MTTTEILAEVCQRLRALQRDDKQAHERARLLELFTLGTDAGDSDIAVVEDLFDAGEPDKALEQAVSSWKARRKAEQEPKPVRTPEKREAPAKPAT